MKLSARRRRLLGIGEQQPVRFSQPCSFMPRERLLALQGGDVYVTDTHLVFAPNLLASLLGRKAWAMGLNGISSVQIETIKLPWWPSPLPVVRLLPASDAGSVRTLAMPDPNVASELAAAIDASG